MTKTTLHALLPALVVMVVACEPKVPARYIQPDDFEDLLYDYQVARTMAEENDSIDDRDAAWATFRQAVFSKHGVSEEQFDSSLVYYTRHSDRLYKIYGSLQDRMRDEAVRWGADAREIGRWGADIAEGDTVNVWRGEPHIVLMHAPPYNFYSYVVETDTTFEKGDKVILSFDALFLYQEGKRDCVATLAVTFANDSVAVRTTHAARNARFNVEIADRDTLGIKSIKGYFCVVNDLSAPQTTMRTVFVNNIRLVRMKTVKTADVMAAAAESRDTLGTDTVTTVADYSTVARIKERHSAPADDSTGAVNHPTPLVKKR